MIFKEFEETYNLAPYALYEFAEGASEITDNPNIAMAAMDYLDARRDFEQALENAGIELG